MLHCEKTYGLLGSCLRNDHYTDHPTYEAGEAYDVDDFSAENDPHGIKKSALLIDMKITASERAAEVKNKPAMFALIWSQISDDSEEAVRRHPTWNTFGPAATNVLELWRVLRDTHTIAAVGVATIDSTKARKTYNGLLQGPSESLNDFKTRTETALRALASYGCQVPTPQEQANDFIDRLDHYRYAEFKAKIDNGIIIDGLDPPASLVEAYNKASSFKVVARKLEKTDTGDIKTRAVFITTSDRLTRPQASQGRGSG
jgi:hypothetical protein